MAPSLYELSQEHARLETILTESGGEWTPEVEAAFAALELGEADRVDAYQAVIANFTAHATACQREVERFQEKGNAANNAARRLKDRMKEYMDQRGVTELKGDIWRAVIQKNGGQRPLCLLRETADMPPEFTTLRLETNVQAIRDALKASGADEIEGVARLEPAGTHIRFR